MLCSLLFLRLPLAINERYFRRYLKISSILNWFIDIKKKEIIINAFKIDIFVRRYPIGFSFLFLHHVHSLFFRYPLRTSENEKYKNIRRGKKKKNVTITLGGIVTFERKTMDTCEHRTHHNDISFYTIKAEREKYIYIYIVHFLLHVQKIYEKKITTN